MNGLSFCALTQKWPPARWRRDGAWQCAFVANQVRWWHLGGALTACALVLVSCSSGEGDAEPTAGPTTALAPTTSTRPEDPRSDSSLPPVSALDGDAYYVVEEGDTPQEIARNLGIPIGQLVLLNGWRLDGDEVAGFPPPGTPILITLPPPPPESATRIDVTSGCADSLSEMSEDGALLIEGDESLGAPDVLVPGVATRALVCRYASVPALDNLGVGDLVSESQLDASHATRLADLANAATSSDTGISCDSGPVADPRVTVIAFDVGTETDVNLWLLDSGDDSAEHACATLTDGVRTRDADLAPFVDALSGLSLPAPVVCLADPGPATSVVSCPIP